MGKCMRNLPLAILFGFSYKSYQKNYFFHKLGFLKRLEISFFGKVIFFKAFKMIFHLGQCPKGPTNNIGKKGLFPF